MKHQDFVKNSKEIAPWRKNLYYLGMGLIVIGVFLFIIPFFTVIRGFSEPFSMGFDSGMGAMLPGIIGFGLILLGSILRGVGAKGLAGSGILLDPEKAREDLHPYTDALGGMARDAVDSFKSAETRDDGQKAQVVVRCRNCKTLNPEDAVYCKQCGKEL